MAAVPSGLDQEKFDRVWRGVLQKEFDVYDAPSLVQPSIPRAPAAPQVPRPGQSVRIWCLRGRSELNGVQALIMDRAEDEYGRVTVQLGRAGENGCVRRYKLKPSRLEPLESERPGTASS